MHLKQLLLIYTAVEVGLETNTYFVNEYSGLVRVCATVKDGDDKCLIPFHFILNFTTGDGTGKFMIIVS